MGQKICGHTRITHDSQNEIPVKKNARQHNLLKILPILNIEAVQNTGTDYL